MPAAAPVVYNAPVPAPVPVAEQLTDNIGNDARSEAEIREQTAAALARAPPEVTAQHAPLLVGQLDD